MTKKPIIGIIPDFDNGGQNSYSTRPNYAIRKNYIDMVIDANATPILIPYDHDSIENYIKIIDGLLVVGGFFDIDPKKYGEEIINETVKLNIVRGDFEFKIIEEFLKTNLPILGICNGMQAINVVRGGKLIQDLPLEKENYMIHEQSKVKGKEDSHIPYHPVNIKENSILHNIVGQNKIITNSSHHQAIRTTGENLEVNCQAEDGIIEGIEDKTHRFCLGVQWHPEFNTNPADKKIFESFVNECAK